MSKEKCWNSLVCVYIYISCHRYIIHMYICICFCFISKKRWHFFQLHPPPVHPPTRSRPGRTPWRLGTPPLLDGGGGSFGQGRPGNALPGNGECLNVKKKHGLGGWFQIFFIFTPIWGRFPIWRSYFSKGLVQPPTRWGMSWGWTR